MADAVDALSYVHLAHLSSPVQVFRMLIPSHLKTRISLLCLRSYSGSRSACLAFHKSSPQIWEVRAPRTVLTTGRRELVTNVSASPSCVWMTRVVLPSPPGRNPLDAAPEPPVVTAPFPGFSSFPVSCFPRPPLLPEITSQINQLGLSVHFWWTLN